MQLVGTSVDPNFGGDARKTWDATKGDRRDEKAWRKPKKGARRFESKKWSRDARNEKDHCHYDEVHTQYAATDLNPKTC